MCWFGLIVVMQNCSSLICFQELSFLKICYGSLHMQAKNDDAARKALQDMFKGRDDILSQNEQIEEGDGGNDDSGKGSGGGGAGRVELCLLLRFVDRTASVFCPCATVYPLHLTNQARSRM